MTQLAIAHNDLFKTYDLVEDIESSLKKLVGEIIKINKFDFQVLGLDSDMRVVYHIAYKNNADAKVLTDQIKHKMPCGSLVELEENDIYVKFTFAMECSY